jgi:flagellar motor protein MotB
LISLAVLAVVAAGFSGCVSMDEYKRLDAAFQQAKQQLAESENDLARLRTQIDGLKAQLAAREGISGGIDSLKAENALLQKKLDDLEARYKALSEFADTIKLPPEVNDKLAKLAAQYPDLLEWDPKLGRLRFKSDLTFDLGSTEVKAGAREALRQLADILNLADIAQNQIRVVGHTDDVPIKSGGAMGMNPNNWFLSTNRAQAIREVLYADGVSDTRIQPAGEGNTQPIAPNAENHKGNAKNRRVEIFILPSVVPDNAVAAPDYDSKPVVSGARVTAPVPRPAPRRTTPRPATSGTPATRPAAPVVPDVPTPTTLPGVG